MDRESSLPALLAVVGLLLLISARRVGWAGPLVDGRPARIVAGTDLGAVGAVDVERRGAWWVARIDLRTARLDLVGQGETEGVRTFAAAEAWAESEGRRLLVATNAGIFEPGQIPTGLYVSGGEEHQPLNTQAGAGNFFLEPNGVFSIDKKGRARVVPTRLHSGAPQLATQSGPLVLAAGEMHPLFNADSPNKRVRSGIGVSPRDRQVVWVALSAEPVRFHEMATFFRDELGCSEALYLDGVISGMAGPELPETAARPGPFAGLLVASVPAD
jgi:uncharacterized protein YigE (DUF2233 family)